MNNINTPIKYSQNGLILCAYCIKIKNRSKRFSSFHALRWHVTHYHELEVSV